MREWNSPYNRHRHRLRLDKVTSGRLSGLPIYHFLCRDEVCHQTIWCYKHEFWEGE